MDQYPEVNVEVQEHSSSASRHDSASSVTKAADFHSPPSLVPSRQPSDNMSSITNSSQNPTQRTSLDSSTLDTTAKEREAQIEREDRKDSIHIDEQTAEKLKAEFSRYTDAPPPYSKDQYADKSEEQQLSMRTHDYAKELSRMMGRQFVRGLRTDDAEDK